MVKKTQGNRLLQQKEWLKSRQLVRGQVGTSSKDYKCPLSLAMDLLPKLMGQSPGDLGSIQGAKIPGFLSPAVTPEDRAMVKCRDFLTIHKVDI